MKRYYKLINVRNLLTAVSSLLLLASCSSYQYAGYDNDGIYSSSSNEEAYTANDYEESYEDALYYKNLFGEKAEQFGAVPEEGAIFTDVESYASGQYDEEMFGEEGLAYEPGRAAWGTDPDEISINIYNNYSPFYYGYGYPYYAGFYDPYWGPYYPYGYYNPYSYRFGYGYGYPYAYHSWGWNVGWNFGWGGYYGHRYYPYYHRNNYYPTYNRRAVAYSATRRNSYSTQDRYRRGDDDSRISRIQSYSNSRNVRAAGTTSRTDARTYQSRTVRVRSSVPERRSSDSYRTSTQRREVPTRTAPARRETQVRTTRSSSNNNSTYRSSSSGSSTRSSGTTTRSSRGRGN